MVVVVALAGGGDDHEKSDTSAIAPNRTTYTIGQTAHTGDFDVTLNTVEDRYTPASQFEAPPAGQRFVAVDLTLRNTSNEQQTMSTSC